MDLNIRRSAAGSGDSPRWSIRFSARRSTRRWFTRWLRLIWLRQSGTKAQKNRSGVSGGGSKPFRQKGNGRARAGTPAAPSGVRVVSPLLRHRNYVQKVNRKMYRGALRSFPNLSARSVLLLFRCRCRCTENQSFDVQVEGVRPDEALIVSDQPDENLYLSARNLKNVDVCDVLGCQPGESDRFRMC